MSAATGSVQPHQRWRRRSDGVLTRILYVDSPSQFRRSVHHQAQRRTITEYGSFLKKYEIVSDAVPTNTSVQDDAAQAGQEKNTTCEGIPVRQSQIYLDTRQSNCHVVIESIADGEAQVRDYYGTKHSTLSVSRMHRNSTGWRLVEQGELKYGAPTASSDERSESR
ncbi:hypothetical protein [Streptomyces cyaneofuscatus]|uniref:hypothetical protein n=1 Tax=Streptomyces cyaneofuscatus TaxID=66883 RepID=UPI003659F6D2